MKPTSTIAIAGNPNCGKTLVFNRLTGSRQKVGNWAGVTVDKKTGVCDIASQAYSIVDLPGIYSLDITTEHQSMDEQIACEFLLSGEVDVILNIVDASNLQRHLYLTAQLLEFGIPTIVALNMQDIAKRKGLVIDHEQLSKQLGCPVVPITASKNKGLDKLKQSINTLTQKPPYPAYCLPEKLKTVVKELTQMLSQDKYSFAPEWASLRLLEQDAYVSQQLDAPKIKQAEQHVAACAEELGESTDLIIADTRYQWVDKLYRKAVKERQQQRKALSQYIDAVVLNRYLGIPIFLLMMYITFFFAINIGGAFQDFFDIGSTAIFIDGLSHVLQHFQAPTWLIAVLANGLGKGINTVITFIPVIGGMFLFLALLEDSGYMARAAYIVDRLMQAIGLPGKAFVPLIVGFGCNVPTVMASRTLGTKRDRILTVMMAPFMSCGARLAIYAVFVSAFFPRGGQNVIFILYLIGIIVAIMTGLILRFTLLKGESATYLNELPAYHLPAPISILKVTWHKLKMFLRKAGRFIIPICMLVGALNAISLEGKLLTGNATQESALSSIGKIITPVFKPMGLKQENWPATVGLFTGLLAKEVVVGTLNTLYSQVGNIHQDADDASVKQGLLDALDSIPNNLAALPEALKNPILASAPLQAVNKGVYGVINKFFDGQVGTFAYLLFILLYFPCVSTMAVMRREIGRRWANFSMLWSTGLAYGFATVFYQAATFSRHSLSSSLWISGVIFTFVITVVTLRLKTKESRHKASVEKST